MPRAPLALSWLALAALTVWAQVLPHLDAIGSSFPGYWLVARELTLGTPAIQLYDDAWLAARMTAEGFPPDRMLGPPALALTALPVAWLSYGNARAVWMIGVLTPCMFASVALLCRRLPPTHGLALGAALLLGRPTEACMEVAQVYPVFLLFHVIALEGWRRDQPWRGGLALAPVILTRGWHGLPQAIGWLVGGRWRGTGAATSGVVLGGLLTLPLLGTAAWWHFLTVQSREVAHSPTAFVTAYQTWRSFALHLTSFDPVFGPDPPLPGAGVWPWVLGAAIIAAATVWAGRRLRPGAGAGFALWTTAALLLAPFAEDYHFVLAAIPVVVWWEEAPRRRAALVLAMLLLWVDWGFDRPELIGGWRSVAAYPRVWGGLVLLAIGVEHAARAPRARATEVPRRHPPATTSIESRP